MPVWCVTKIDFPSVLGYSSIASIVNTLLRRSNATRNSSLLLASTRALLWYLVFNFGIVRPNRSYTLKNSKYPRSNTHRLLRHCLRVLLSPNVYCSHNNDFSVLCSLKPFRVSSKALYFRFKWIFYYGPHFDEVTEKPFHCLKLQSCKPGINQSIRFGQLYSLLRFQTTNTFNKLTGW